jgi:hypothetical protein
MNRILCKRFNHKVLDNWIDFFETNIYIVGLKRFKLGWFELGHGKNKSMSLEA